MESGGEDSKKYIILCTFTSVFSCENGEIRQHEQFSGDGMCVAKITYKWNDKMIWKIEDNEYITDESIPDKIVFKKYNKKDVDLEALGFDLSFLEEPESE